MDAASYLQRIRYDGPLSPDAGVLRLLQVAHLRSVPFENLSIQLGEPIVLDDRALFEKIVWRRRGGFCYELNGLFAWLLRSLGFHVSMLAAEVRNGRGEWGPPFDHMALLVTMEDRWLVDVGFGDSFLEPLRLVPGIEQPQLPGSFRLDEHDTRFVVMRRDASDAGWTPQYRFDLAPYEYADYEPMCRYHQTSPDSHFTRGRVCSMATLDGRVTLSGTRLIVTAAQGRREQELAGEAHCLAVLRDHFGIDLAASGA